MKLLTKIILTLTLACAIAFSGGTAYAQNTSLPEGFIIVDGDGVSASSDGDYLVSINGIEPGDVFVKTITIRNMEKGKPFKLYMTAESEEVSGPVNLMEKCGLTIEMDGQTIYNGRLDGDAAGVLKNDALSLSSYNYGDTKVMKMTFTLDDDWEIGYEQSKATFRWNFHAIKDEQADPPKTGEFQQYALYVLGGCMALALVMLFIISKRREKKEQPAK